MSFINREYGLEDTADQWSVKTYHISRVMAGPDYFHCSVANWAAFPHHSLRFTARSIPAISLTLVFEQSIPHATQTVEKWLTWKRVRSEWERGQKEET